LKHEVVKQALLQMDPELLDAFVDNPYECSILVDSNGVIRFMSRYNTKIYGMEPHEAIGKHITEVSKNTRMHLVLETGKAEIGMPMKLGDREQIVARIPLKNSRGRVIGVLGKLMFHEVEKIKELYHRLEVLESQVKYYQNEILSLGRSKYLWEQIIGESEALRKAKKAALQAASSESPILITGESGTGKELFANAIHHSSARAQGPFVRVNCAAIPSELIESELFGYEHGAFTGARSTGKAGKFELADGGTILLDEIGHMPLKLQAKLLRVVQEYEVERIGGTRPIKLNFRIIAATNQDLLSLIKQKTFRQDLFYRLNIFHVQLPSLREMRDDIPRLAYYFLSVLREKRHSAPRRISQEAMAILKKYHWPGNIRELKNTIERAIYVAEGDQINVFDLPPRIQQYYQENHGVRQVGDLRRIIEDTEKRVITETLRLTKGNKAKASRILGIHRTALYQKMKRYGLNV